MNKLAKSLLRKKRKKESWLKYIIAVLHLWLGLLSAIVIIIVCISGCLYSFRNQIIDLYNYEKVYVKKESNTLLSLNEIQELIEKDNKSVISLTSFKNQNKNLYITYKEQDTDIYRSSYVNPYTGKLLGEADTRLNNFFEIVLDIHKNLFLGNVGKQIVGISTLIFIVLLISGLFLWWPKSKRDLKNGLRIKLKARFYRFNYDLHNTLGFYALIFLIFISITGVYITYPWMKNAVILSLGGDSILSPQAENDLDSNSFEAILLEMETKEKEKTEFREAKILPIESILELAKEHTPYKAKMTTVRLPDESEPRYTVTKIRSNWLGIEFPNIFSFDKEGKLKNIEKFSDKKLSAQFMKLSKELHTGEAAGLPGIFLYFVATLIGASLPITGFIIWWKKVK